MSLLKPIRVFHACMITTLGFNSLSFMNTYTSPIEDELLERGVLTVNTYPIFVSILNTGGLIGSLIAGPISEWLGIKTSLILFSQLGTLGAMLLVVAHDGVSMIVARFLIGFYSSMCLTVIPVYNAEVSPESLKRSYGGILGLSMRFGMLLSYSLGIWLGYRWLAVVYMLMVVFMNLNLVFLPESPKWLRNKGWTEKADLASEYFYDSPQESAPLISNETGNQPGIQSENKTYVTSVDLSENTSISRSTSVSQNTILLHHSSINTRLSEKISSYFVWPVIRPLLVCCSIQAFKAYSGHQYLLAYSAHTLDNAVSINPRIAALFYAIFLLTGSVLSLWVINRVHWKKLLLVTTFAQVIVNALMSLTLFLSIRVLECTNIQGSIFCHVLQFSPIPLVGIFGFTFSMGWGAIGWMLYGELLHSYYTRISAGICTFVFIVSCIINLLVGPLIVQYLGSYTLFLIYAVLCLIGLIIQLFY